MCSQPAWNGRAVGYFGQNLIQPFYFTVNYRGSGRVNTGPNVTQGQAWDWTWVSAHALRQCVAMPRGCVPSTCLDISSEWHLHCFLAEGVRILPLHLVGFTKRLLLRAVCSFGQFVLFLLQVNNSVVHTSFHLHGEPIKVSLVMESTLTRFVYFWHQEDLKIRTAL